MNSVRKPAGEEASAGVLTAVWRKEPGDPKWDNDQDMKDYRAFMKQWAASEPEAEGLAMHGYVTAKMIEAILKRCGDDLTRGNLLEQATSVKELQLPLFIPGVFNISSAHRVAWRSARIAKFEWQRLAVCQRPYDDCAFGAVTRWERQLRRVPHAPDSSQTTQGMIVMDGVT